MEKETTRLCITVDEMAKQLGIGLTNAYKLVKQKNPIFYPAKKICGRYVISCKQLEKWLDEQNK